MVEVAGKLSAADFDKVVHRVGGAMVPLRGDDLDGPGIGSRSSSSLPLSGGFPETEWLKNFFSPFSMMKRQSKAA